VTDPDDGKQNGGPAGSFKAIRAASPLIGAGVQMAAAVILMFFVGRWLDAKFGTDPWLMITGIFFGVGGGLYAFVRTVSDVDNAEEKKSTKE